MRLHKIRIQEHRSFKLSIHTWGEKWMRRSDSLIRSLAWSSRHGYRGVNAIPATRLVFFNSSSPIRTGKIRSGLINSTSLSRTNYFH